VAGKVCNNWWVQGAPALIIRTWWWIRFIAGTTVVCVHAVII